MPRTPRKDSENLKQINQLEAMANSILDLKKKVLPRRPIVIEFCGSPKAGKSSCINSLDIFLRRNDFRTKILTERASVCPIRNKFDPLFNIWTSCSALAQLSAIIANNPRDYDIVFMDRGIFDSVCWFEWGREEGYLREDDYGRFVSFFTALKWRSVIDIVFVFDATPETSMDREYRNLLTRREGSVMRPKILNSYRAAARRATKKHGKNFRSVISVNTSGKKQNAVSYEVTKKCLERLREVTTEKIGYFDLGHIGGMTSAEVVPFADIESALNGGLKFGDRDLVESNPGFVQPIAAALIKDSGTFRFLIAKKRQTAAPVGSPEHGRLLLYFGGHVRDEDAVTHERGGLNKIFQQALYRELKEELGLDADLASKEPVCVWVKRNGRRDKHFALIYVVERDLDHLKLYIDEREFVRTKKDSTGSVIGGTDILKRLEELDDWSSRALEALFAGEMEHVRSELGVSDLFGGRGHVKRRGRSKQVTRVAQGPPLLRRHRLG